MQVDLILKEAPPPWVGGGRWDRPPLSYTPELCGRLILSFPLFKGDYISPPHL